MSRRPPFPPDIEPGLEATHYFDPPPATFANGAHLAVVDVDLETGHVELLRYDHLHGLSAAQRHHAPAHGGHPHRDAAPVTLGGFKGMAEGGTIGATATIANAVADALAPLGITVTDLPLSPERIAKLVVAAAAAHRR